MNIADRPVADLHHLEWTAQINSHFAEMSVVDVALAVVARADRTIDRAIHPHHQQLRRIAVNDPQANSEVDSIIEKSADSGIRFVQIGAHNGEFDDPFSKRIAAHGWLSLLVEPQTDAYSELAVKYKDSPLVTCVNAAIADEPGLLTLHKAVLANRHSLFGTAIASTERAQVRDEVMRCKGFFAGLATRIVQEEVVAMTLPQLLSTHNRSANSIDFFACDTEGYDAKIMKQLFTDVGAHPEFVQWEHIHLGADDALQTAKEAEVRGYSLITTHKDTFGYL